MRKLDFPVTYRRETQGSPKGAPRGARGQVTRDSNHRAIHAPSTGGDGVERGPRYQVQRSDLASSTEAQEEVGELWEKLSNVEKWASLLSSVEPKSRIREIQP
jgi:hypothetical protein